MSLEGPIRITGRGPVAIALRLLLAREGIGSSAIRADDAHTAPPDWLAQRPIALSLGSLQLLARVAPDLSPLALAAGSAPAAPISKVDISRQSIPGHAQMDCAELAEPLLGAVIRYGPLLSILQTALRAGGPIASSSDGPQPTAGCALEVIADGETERSSMTERRFSQVALLAEVAVSADQRGIAYERFTSEGPLALLPLPEPNHRALVWCAPEPIARERAAAQPEAFNQSLERAFGASLGRIEVAGPRHISPVSRRTGPILRAARQVAIGNAAQALHPVAGQGLNLGLRDAAALARALGDVQAAEVDLDQALAGFARQRQRDRALVVGTTDLLATWTCSDLLAPAHAIGLAGIDACAPLRKALARAFMHGPRVF